jgi:hypothetical protein
VGAVAQKPAARTPRPPAPEVASEDKFEPTAAGAEFNMEGLIRDERGVRMAPESDD